VRATAGPAVPAIVMSALRPNPRLCAELDAHGVLEKPFAMESLLRLVAEATTHEAGLKATDGGQEGVER